MKTARWIFLFGALVFSAGCDRKASEPEPYTPTWELAETPLATGAAKVMVDGRLHRKGFLAAINTFGVWTFDSLSQYPSSSGLPGPARPNIGSTLTLPLTSLNMRYRPVWNDRLVLRSQPGDNWISLFDYSSENSTSGRFEPVSSLAVGYTTSAKLYSFAGTGKPFAAFNDANQLLVPVSDTEPGYSIPGLSYLLVTLRNDNTLDRFGFSMQAVESAKKLAALVDNPVVIGGEERLPTPGITAVFGFKDRFFVSLNNDSNWHNMVLSDGTVRTLPFTNPALFFTFRGELHAIQDVSPGLMRVSRSPDAGETWVDLFPISGTTFAEALTFTEIDGQLYVFSFEQLWRVDTQTGQFTEMSVEGLQRSKISAVVKYGPWVYAMTLSGLYRIKAKDFAGATRKP